MLGAPSIVPAAGGGLSSSRFHYDYLPRAECREPSVYLNDDSLTQQPERPSIILKKQNASFSYPGEMNPGSDRGGRAVSSRGSSQL